ncbi:putative metalloprotease CJM1_0395 family protein [Campylobacter sp.]|uniref:putative metalloprotease CJM1_0395 family protein n=1 Tax=Campylobacter sp. TaxID=205 RepID=UPI0025C44496|nr:putative metalloprotease CJM1_0395 family protein [Campylobacter sp.]
MQINSSFNNFFYPQYTQDSKKTNQEDQLTPENKNTENEDENKEKNTQRVNGKDLNQEEIRQVRELEKIDREVRAHEAAHQAAGGALAGAASFGYTKGPDDKMYAIEGEVPIRMQKGNTPEETIANAMQVISAAMAPADPSPQDYKVAANAMQMQNDARMEQIKLKAEKSKKENEENEETSQDKNSQDKNSQDKNDKNSHTKAIKAYTQSTGYNFLGNNLNKNF